MAIVFQVATVGAGNGSSNTVTTSSINTIGSNFIVVCVAWGYNAALTQTVSDSQSNTWTALNIYGPQATGSTNENTQIFYCISPSTSSTHTFSTTASNLTYQAIAVECFSGVSSSPFDNQSGIVLNLPGLTTGQPGSITPSANGELFITCAAASSTSSDSIDSSFNANELQVFTAGNNYGLSVAYLIEGPSSATAENPTWTFGTQANSFGSGGIAMACFKPQVSALGDPAFPISQPVNVFFPQIVSV